MKVILSINAGSSSVKLSAYSAEKGQAPSQLAEAQLSGLTSPPVKLKYFRRGGAQQVAKDQEVKERGGKVDNQDSAFRILLQTLIDDGDLPEIAGKGDVAIACHRVVHGGGYETSQVIDRETYHHLERLTDLAPLHNASALAIVKTCLAELPGAVNVACFDSQFHATIPEHIHTYPINPDIASKNQLRKYGFHGISYQFITDAVAKFLGKDPGKLNIIALHLGSGASACAIRNGKSWDTSMGLTPLAGLPGATRSGSVDPSLVFHYASSDVGKLSPSSTRDLHISRAEEILNKQSGWKALTGTTDFAAIASASADNDNDNDNDSKDGDRKKLAFDLFANRICGYVGSYYVALGGQVDALVFAGGIGEKSARLRRRVVEQAACLGFRVGDDDDGDDTAEPTNEGDVVCDISSSKEQGGGARHKVLVCRTDEQFQMAKMCAHDEVLWSS